MFEFWRVLGFIGGLLPILVSNTSPPRHVQARLNGHLRVAGWGAAGFGFGAAGLGGQAQQGGAAAHVHAPGSAPPLHSFDDVAALLRKLPVEEHATKAELDLKSVRELRELLRLRRGAGERADAAAGGGCSSSSSFREKRELVELLLSEGGSSAGQCSICFEDYASGDLKRLLRCGHFFHLECIDRWFLSSASDQSRRAACPLCNTPLFPEDQGTGSGQG